MKTINSFRSRLLTITLALMAGVASFAYDYHGDLLCYNILTDSTVAVTGQSEYKTMPRYEYLPENLVIPAEVTLQGKTYKVVSIDQWAFYACAMLKSVIIPHTVTFIGMSAFHYCENLADVYIPYSVTTVEGSAFAYTKWYDNLPDGEVYINNTLYRYKGTAPENTKIVVKDGTTHIAGFTFWNQSNIVSVELPQSLTVIEHSAFEGCTQLDSILIPYYVTYIGANAFADCTGLSTVTCIAPTPPTMGQFANPSSNSEIFARVDVSNATLYVRSESVEAYKNADQWKEFGQILPIKPLTAEDFFPTLTGLQRTEVKVHTTGADAPHIVSFDEYTHTLLASDTQKMYLTNDRLTFLREENNQVLLYAPSYGIKEDVVLYDWTLEVGDTLPYNKYTVLKEADFIVTDVSTITLLDGKEYKKWTLACGIEYIEGIGAINGGGYGNFFCLQHSEDPAIYIENRLVCASRNGQLLYQMDDAEMERLGAECLCDVETSYKDQWCNKWNVMWFDGLFFDETASTSQYRLGKDTIIGDYTYSKFTSRTSVRFTSDRKVYVYYEGFDDNDPYTIDLPTGEYLAYDFSAQVGDTLEVFSGVGTYSTYSCVVDDVEAAPSPCVVDDVQADLKTFPLIIKLRPLCDVDGEGNLEISSQEITWIEGIGSPDGFLISNPPCGLVGGGTFALLCAYKGDELKYTGSLYDEYGCEYNATKQNPEDLFPTLWGLQRTSFTEYFDSGHQPESEPVLLQAGNIKEIGGKLYLDFGQYLREENGKIYIYSELLQKDFVLYDFTLELGDTLTTLNWDYNNPNSDGTISVVDYAVDCPIDTLIVTDISTITLLDGKEYKKWIFNHGYFGYVESIGTLSGLFYELSQSCMVVPGCYMGDHLVCASRNGKLLYQMDDAEMERLGAECLCDYDSGPKKDHAKDGQIGGRPTPTQWNQLEVVLRQMDNNHTILQAETFSYTLEDISQQMNNKTYFQLARQSTKDTATIKSVVGALYFGKDEDNRVYFLRDGVEYVLYDFTAEPGDTVEIFAGINNYPQETTYTHVVVDKDTTEDGACRMFLEVVFSDETTTATNAEKVWLAGLGSVDGIVHNAAKRTSNAHAAPSRSASSETESSVMLCAWREDSCLYTTNHPDYDTFGCVYNQDPTAVEDISTSQSSFQKLLRNGQLLIIHKGKTYNVLGVQIK